MKINILIAAASLVAIQPPACAGTGVPPACAGGAFTVECLNFGDASREGLTRYRLEHDQDTASGARVAPRSEAQKAEILRLTKALLRVERENTELKHSRGCQFYR